METKEEFFKRWKLSGIGMLVFNIFFPCAIICFFVCISGAEISGNTKTILCALSMLLLLVYPFLRVGMMRARHDAVRASSPFGRYLLLSMTVTGLFLSCSKPVEEEIEETTPEISAVEEFISPADNSSFELAEDMANVKFEWQKAKASAGIVPRYEVIFFAENGTPSEPIYTITATVNNSIIVNQTRLNEIAAKAGIEVGSGGIVKWTVRAYYQSLSTMSTKVNKIIVIRSGEAEPVTRLFLTGRGTEFGEDISESMEFIRISDAEFTIFSKLTGGQPFKFISNNEGNRIRSFSVEDGRLIEDGASTAVAKTAVYKIHVNLTSAVVAMREITEISLFYSIKERAIPLQYEGRGIWKTISLINFSRQSWGDERRYKFRMAEVQEEQTVNKFLERLAEGSSSMKEVLITDQRAQLWGDIWSYPTNLKDRWAEVIVNMNSYTHNIGVVPENFNLPGTWQAIADRSTSDFVKGYWNSTRGHFNNSISGTVNPNDYWPEAHALDVVIDAYTRTNDNKYKQIITAFYEGVRAKNGVNNDWKNNYYDDMAWHALTHLRAFEATGDPRYEVSAENLWRWILVGWDYAGDGGIKWRETPASGPGVPSTGPATIAGVRRWAKYGETETELPDGLNDLQWAKRMYEWMREKRHDPATGGVYDDMPKVESAWTYITGTFLGSAMELYDVTKEWHYLEDAMRTADWALANTSVQTETNRILSDWAEQMDNDVNLFKGIFIRYFTRLIMNPDLPANKRAEYINFIEYNAKALVTYASGIGERDVMIFNYGWYFKPRNSFLRGQTSACMLIEALALLEKEGFL
jgi:predicted alpha-1,6-mannanase (GH76 family)